MTSANPPQIVRVVRPDGFDKALEAARGAWALDYGVVLRTVLVRDGLEPAGLVERYEVVVLDRPPVVEGESEDGTWGQTW
ncbi:hypothetical protein [Streptomyces sp. NPDC001068]|uniref:hypothetical protein n=1 Tax=Streptomyces sp. NPDC001068 TaxID=3364544 RepID=UPI0036AC5F27